MSIKRLTEGWNATEDSCVSGIHPMRPSDPLGIYLGPNPMMRGEQCAELYLTYWEACEIATKIGYPMPEVYEQQRLEIDQQARKIAALEDDLRHEINTLQLKAVSTEVKNMKKELLNALEGYAGAVRGIGSQPSPVAQVTGRGRSDSLAAAGQGKRVTEGKRPTL